MEIVVLLKQTFDTEEKIVFEQGEISQEGVKFIINPYDEYAVEEAIRLQEKHGGKVTVVSVGPERCAEALRSALAMGADEAVLIDDERITGDEYAVARVLHGYVSGLKPDLLLGGYFSVDNGAGQVAVRLAALLDIPHVGSITKLELDGDSALVRRDAEGDEETVEVKLPALFTAQQGLNDPRYPSLPGIMKAKRKPFARLTLDDLGLSEPDIAARTARLGIEPPPSRKAGRILQGEPEDQVKTLVQSLRNEAKII